MNITFFQLWVKVSLLSFSKSWFQLGLCKNSWLSNAGPYSGIGWITLEVGWGSGGQEMAVIGHDGGGLLSSDFSLSRDVVSTFFDMPSVSPCVLY